MNSAKIYTITEEDGGTRELRITERRTAWAVDELLDAGTEGLTTLERPAPRWSSYVHKLRHRHGLDVRTITEQHAGEFAGHHARYVLRSKVQRTEHASHNSGPRPSQSSLPGMAVTP